MISSSSMTRMELFIVLVPEARKPGRYTRTPAGPRTRPTRSGLVDPGGRAGQGEPQLKPLTLPVCTLAGDGAAVLLNDPVGNRQAEPGALPNRLRGEE